MTFPGDEDQRASNPQPANDPSAPNPGDPGPPQIDPRTPQDPYENPSIPPQRDEPHGA